MRLFFLTCLLSTSLHAAEINCYAGDTRIYHGFGHNLAYNNKYIAFTEDKSGELIMINADCIVFAPSEFMGCYKAATQGKEKHR